VGWVCRGKGSAVLKSLLEGRGYLNCRHWKNLFFTLQRLYERFEATSISCNRPFLLAVPVVLGLANGVCKAAGAQLPHLDKSDGIFHRLNSGAWGPWRADLVLELLGGIFSL